MELEKWETEELTELVIKYGVTAYDAQYLLLAKAQKCKVVTVDKGLLDVKEWVVGVEEVARSMVD